MPRFPRPGPILLDTPHALGATAFRLGKRMAENPWPLLSQQHKDWDDGWLDALAQGAKFKPEPE